MACAVLKCIEWRWHRRHVVVTFLAVFPVYLLKFLCILSDLLPVVRLKFEDHLVAAECLGKESLGLKLCRMCLLLVGLLMNRLLDDFGQM
jgi:hypothetical protein